MTHKVITHPTEKRIFISIKKNLRKYLIVVVLNKKNKCLTIKNCFYFSDEIWSFVLQKLCECGFINLIINCQYDTVSWKVSSSRKFMNLNCYSGQKEPKNFGRRHNTWNNINQGKLFNLIYILHTLKVFSKICDMSLLID